MGIIGAAILAVPSTLLLNPLPPAEAYLATVAAVASGLVCIALPWERMDARWLHLVGVIATLEAACAVEIFGNAYMAFFFLIAVAVAYVTPDPRSLLIHLVFVAVALAALVAFGSGDARSTAQMALVVYPLVVLTACTFAYLRQRMVADHHSYRLFAEETLALSNRIAGRPVSAHGQTLSEELDELPALSRFHVSARAAAALACVLSLPLLTAGLATAGVKVPAFATDALGNVGIDLPNQTSDGEDAGASADRPGADGNRHGGSPGDSDGGDAATPAPEASAGNGASPDPGDSPAGAEAKPYSEGASGTGASPPAGAAPPVPGGSTDPGATDPAGIGDTGGSNPLNDVLEDTVNGLGLGGLLGGQREASPPDEPSAE